MSDQSDQPSWVPLPAELVIGLVGPIGADLELVRSELQHALEKVGVTQIPIGVLEEVPGFGETRNLRGATKYKKRMKLGSAECRSKKDKAKLARLAIRKIRRLRAEHLGLSVTSEEAPTLPRHAFVLHQLKRPAEVDLLRTVYGKSFWLISATASRKNRVDSLADRFARESYKAKRSRFKSKAEKLVSKDEDETNSDKYGQNVRDTFHKGDLFLNTMKPEQVQYEIRRLLRVIFNYQFNTPTRDELGMAHAYTAGLRSSDLSRQVGASICEREGSIVATGCNEVPKAFGGQVWPKDKPDSRQFQKKTNISQEYKEGLLGDVLKRLEKQKLLQVLITTHAHSIESLVKELLEDSDFKQIRLMDTIEFGRSVHAEMAAITDAARRGVGIQHHTLYTTTFPCHGCTAHIVSSGIERLVYLEPYPKSLARELFGDEINIDGDDPNDPEDRRKIIYEPFVGIAPTRFSEVFLAGERRGAEKAPVDWKVEKYESKPRIIGNREEYWFQEQQAVKILGNQHGSNDHGRSTDIRRENSDDERGV